LPAATRALNSLYAIRAGPAGGGSWRLARTSSPTVAAMRTKGSHFGNCFIEILF
jgi:hypothetical protein